MNTNYAIEHNAPTAVFQKEDLGPTQSLYLQFAQFQLAMAAQARAGAEDRLQGIRATQDEQKQVSAMLQEARKLQMQAKSDSDDQKTKNKESSGESDSTMMSTEMEDFLKEHNLTYEDSGVSRRQNADEWKVAIESLTDYQENLGMDTQQQMVYIQDFMGQYNSYLQGANTQISNSNQTLTSLARGQ